MKPRSALNYVWVGPPRLKKGGHDVIGINSLWQNYETHHFNETDRNPLVFWCQSQYCEDYKAYFNQQKMKVAVKSIDAFLEEKLVGQKEIPIEKINAVFKKLTKDPERNKIIDYVCIKDLFYLLILATNGGYVIDTNVLAADDKPVTFPAGKEEPTHFTFPFLDNNVPEVWMQFCPPEDQDTIISSIACWFRLFENASFPKPYTEDYHAKVAALGVNAISCGDLAMFTKICRVNPANFWCCETSEQASIIHLAQFNLTKEYFNSHLQHRQEAFSGQHVHIIYGEAKKVKFDCEHGLNVKETRTISRLGECKLHCDKIESITPLHMAFMYSGSTNEYYECAKILLDYDADINAKYTITHTTGRIEESSPLRDAIKNNCERRVSLALAHKANVTTLLNNESPLLSAVKFNFGVPQLLEAKADPNQQWEGQVVTPLISAVERNKLNLVKLLLQHGADVNLQMPRKDELGRVIFESAIHVALQESTDDILEELLKHNPNLEAPLSVQVKDKLYQTPVEKIATSDKCKAILSRYISNQEKDQCHFKP